MEFSECSKTTSHNGEKGGLHLKTDIVREEHSITAAAQDFSIDRKRVRE